MYGVTRDGTFYRNTDFAAHSALCTVVKTRYNTPLLSYRQVNMTTFAKLGLNPTLQANIKRLGYTTPTEIQEKSIGAVLSGADTYAIAPTGTGKTAAYLLPTLQELSQVDNSDKQVRPLRALFLVPTRELALQVEASIAEFDTDLKLRTISVLVVCGSRHKPSALNAVLIF